MSMYIGGEININNLSRACFEAAAKEVGLGVKKAMEEYERIYDLLPQALERAGDLVSQQGILGAEEMVSRIKRRNEK